MEHGVVNRIIVGKEVIHDGIMNYQIDHLYKNRTIKVSKIKEEYIEGVYWIKVYITKVDDEDKLLYLWWRISHDMKVQYLLDI